MLKALKKYIMRFGIKYLKTGYQLPGIPTRDVTQKILLNHIDESLIVR